MDPRRRALLDRLWQEGRDFDAAQPDHLGGFDHEVLHKSEPDDPLRIRL